MICQPTTDRESWRSNERILAAQMSSGVLKDKWCLITGAGKGVVRARHL